MPHSDHSPSPDPSTTFPDLPPFPDNVPTAPLLRISLDKLLIHDKDEEERCWKACQELGFFYLDLRSPDDETNIEGEGGQCQGKGEALLTDTTHLFDLMKTFYGLPVTEKVRYDFKSQGSYFGYKGYGEGIIDAKGTRDRNEFYNISKDDVLGLAERLPTPECLDGEAQRALFQRYIHHCHGICERIIELLSERLPLKAQVRENGSLQALHGLQRRSGDQIRFVRAPPQEPTTRGVALGEHTDFGSVTVLFNRLGGLQVRLPEHMQPVPPSDASGGASEVEKRLCEGGWCYVRPLAGHAIVNLGDALVKFSNAWVRSNVHRVVAPPGRQAEVTRFSLVYFCRPEDDIALKGLVEGEEGVEEEVVTAKEWILRRALGRREVDGWEKSGGTEEGSMRKGGMRA